MFTLLYVWWEYSRFAPETANECTASSIIIRAREVPYFKADGVADDIYALILLHADWVRRYSIYIYGHKTTSTCMHGDTLFHEYQYPHTHISLNISVLALFFVSLIYCYFSCHPTMCVNISSTQPGITTRRNTDDVHTAGSHQPSRLLLIWHTYVPCTFLCGSIAHNLIKFGRTRYYGEY